MYVRLNLRFLSLRRIIAIFNRLLKICIFVSNVCTGNKYDADVSVHSQRPVMIAIGLYSP